MLLVFCFKIQIKLWIKLKKKTIFANLAVQEERGPRKPKPINQSNTLSLSEAKDRILAAQVISKSNTLPFTTSCTFNYNILAQILIACVTQAKSNENFQQLSSQQRKMILKHVWTECFVLRASYWPIDISPIIEQ